MIKVTKDGRTIRTGKHYTQFREAIWSRCDGWCEMCHKPMVFDWECLNGMHIHHKNGRGLGGGKRDDSPQAVLGICNKCHRKEHGQ